MIINSFFFLEMNRTFLLKTLAYIALVATLFSCQDHSLGVQSQRFRLKKTVTSAAIGSPTTTIYNYDNTGKLANYSVASPILGNVLTMLLYDNQSRLTGMEEKTAGVLTGKATYTYDGNGRIGTVNKSVDDPNQAAGNLALSETFTFTYGSDNLPISASSVASNGTTGQYVYTYTNGNVTKLDYSLSSGLSNSATFTFDNSPNPYRGVMIFRQGLYDLTDAINTNNYNSVPPIYTLEYDSNSFLSKRTISGPFGVQTTYEYEAY